MNAASWMIIDLIAGSLIMAVGARLADLGRPGRYGDLKGLRWGAHVKGTTSQGTESFEVTRNP